MRHFLLLLLFVCTTNTLFAQEPLSSMPKEERDSILVDIVQKILKNKFPELYRKNIKYSIGQGDFMFYSLKWVQKDDFYRIPDYLKPEDLNYEVSLYYDKWKEEGLESPCIAQATIIDKTHEVFKIWLGANSISYWYLLRDFKPSESLASMLKDKRDSLLVEIAQNVLKEEYPNLYRKDVIPSISQYDFKSLKWSGKKDIYLPDFVEFDDVYYAVKLYYEKWKEEGFESHYTAIVYILDRTREAYKIQLGTEDGESNIKKVNSRKTW